MRPFFSIIIPTYNRPKQLSNCLHSLSNLDYPPDRYEVIVVDDGSEKPIENVIARYRGKMKLTSLRQHNSGPAAARNTGAKQAKGEILTFTDDDCIPSPDWLLNLCMQFSNTPNCVIGGRIVNLLKDNFYSFVSQLIVDVVYRHYNKNPDQAQFFTSNNIAIPRHIFFKIGGFDPTFYTSEDRELCDRLLHHGFNLIYAPDVLVYHAHALKLGSFCRLHFNYGRGAYNFLQVRSRRKSLSLYRDIKFYLNFSNWLFYPFSQTKDRQKLLLAMMIFVWQIANFSGVFWEAINQALIMRNQG